MSPGPPSSWTAAGWPKHAARRAVRRQAGEVRHNWVTVIDLHHSERQSQRHRLSRNSSQGVAEGECPRLGDHAGKKGG